MPRDDDESKAERRARRLAEAQARGPRTLGKLYRYGPGGEIVDADKPTGAAAGEESAQALQEAQRTAERRRAKDDKKRAQDEARRAKKLAAEAA